MARKNRWEAEVEINLSDPVDDRNELDPLADLNEELVRTGEHAIKERSLLSPCDRPMKVDGIPVGSDKFRKNTRVDECHSCATPDGQEDDD